MRQVGGEKQRTAAERIRSDMAARHTTPKAMADHMAMARQMWEAAEGGDEEEMGSTAWNMEALDSIDELLAGCDCPDALMP